MLNITLYKRGIRENWKVFTVIAAVVSMYVAIIIPMYDPEMMKMLDDFTVAMPEITKMFGMNAGANTLLGFLSSYLYGMILTVFPMVFTIIVSNRLIARLADGGSMAYLLAAPVKRPAIAFTQMKVMGTGIFALIVLVTLLQLILCESAFPGGLAADKLLLLNVGLFALQLFIGGICFLCSCVFNSAKNSIGFGAGITAFSYVLQMVAQLGGKCEGVKYATFFTLYNPDGIIAGESAAIFGIAVLFAGAAALFGAAITIFSRKDLHI